MLSSIHLDKPAVRLVRRPNDGGCAAARRGGFVVGGHYLAPSTNHTLTALSRPRSATRGRRSSEAPEARRLRTDLLLIAYPAWRAGTRQPSPNKGHNISSAIEDGETGPPSSTEPYRSPPISALLLIWTIVGVFTMDPVAVVYCVTNTVDRSSVKLLRAGPRANYWTE